MLPLRPCAPFEYLKCVPCGLTKISSWPTRRQWSEMNPERRVVHLAFCGPRWVCKAHSESLWKAEGPPTFGPRPKRLRRDQVYKVRLPQFDVFLKPHKVHQPAIMSQDSEIVAHLRSLPLNSTWLVLDPETESFFKAETGIQDSES